MRWLREHAGQEWRREADPLYGQDASCTRIARQRWRAGFVAASGPDMINICMDINAPCSPSCLHSGAAPMPDIFA